MIFFLLAVLSLLSIALSYIRGPWLLRRSRLPAAARLPRSWSSSVVVSAIVMTPTIAARSGLVLASAIRAVALAIVRSSAEISRASALVLQTSSIAAGPSSRACRRPMTKPSPARSPTPGPRSGSAIRIRDPRSAIRDPDPRSGSGIGIRDRDPASGSGIGIRDRNPGSGPGSGSGLGIRDRDPGSGIRDRGPGPDPGRFAQSATATDRPSRARFAVGSRFATAYN